MADSPSDLPPLLPDDSVVDETLLDWMATLSPEERLRHNDRTITMILELRKGLPKDPGTDHG